MKAAASQFLGLTEAEENPESQESEERQENLETTMIIRSVAIATTQTEECPRSQESEEDLEANTNKIITSVATQTEKVSLDPEERLGEQINQLRCVVEGNSGVLAQLLPLIQNIQQ